MSHLNLFRILCRNLFLFIIIYYYMLLIIFIYYYLLLYIINYFYLLLFIFIGWPKSNCVFCGPIFHEKQKTLLTY